MAFARQNPKIPEGINTSQDHPLKDFLILLSGITATLIVVIILLTVFTQSLAQYIPFRYEQKLSGVYESIQERYADEDIQSDISSLADAELAIQELGMELAELAELPDDMRLHFHLMDAPDVPNAFATLGGHIFITTGLLNELSSENALAMVMAHEIAHVKYRHPIKGLSSGIIVQFTLSMITGSQGGASVRDFLGNTSLITMLSFSRDMELEADEEARHIILKRYGHLHQADEFFQKMSQHEHRADWQEVFNTHPNLNKRLERFETFQTSHMAEPAVIKALDPRLTQLQQELAPAARDEAKN